MKYFLTLCLVLMMVVACRGNVPAQAVNQGCTQFEIQAGFGCTSSQPFPAPYYQQILPSSSCGTNGSGDVRPAFTTQIIGFNPTLNPNVFATYDTGLSSAVVTPGVCVVNIFTGAITYAGTVPQTCTSNNAHNSMTLGDIGGGTGIGIYCALDAPIACLNSSGGPGSTALCGMYLLTFTCAGAECPAGSQGVNHVDVLATASPSAIAITLSEAATAGIGPNNLLISGQTQRASPTLLLGGQSQGYVSLTLLGNGTFTVDQACAQGGGLSSYNPVTTAITSACNPAQNWTLQARDDVLYTIAVTSDVSGQPMQGTFGAVPGFTGAQCGITMTGTLATDVATFAADIATGSLTGSANCSSTGTAGFSGVVVQNTGFGGCAVAPCVGVLHNTGPTPLVPFAAPTAPACGTGACTYTNETSEYGGGVHGLAQFGGASQLIATNGLPRIYEVFDNEFTANYATGKFANAGGYGINMAVFCAWMPPNAEVWTWGDVTCGADGFVFTMSPAQLNAQSYFLGSGGGGFETSPTQPVMEYVDLSGVAVPAWPIVRNCNAALGNCVAGPPAFVYNYSQATQNGITSAPVYETYSVALNAQGNVVINYGYELSGGLIQSATMTISSTTGQTIAQGPLDNGFTAISDLADALIAAPSGHLVGEVATANGASCSSGCSTGTNIIQYVSTNFGASWTRSVIKSLGGANVGTNGCAFWRPVDKSRIWQICQASATSGTVTMYLFDNYTWNL